MPSITKLNIGGVTFHTSRSTLTKYDGMFRTMLETGVPLEKDDTGCIFIDRDPKHFRLILNFMRDSATELPEDSKEVREILKECEFYLLRELSELCENHLNMLGKVIKPDYQIVKDTEELMELLMKASKDVLVLFFPNKNGSVYFYNQKLLDDFIQKHKDNVEIVLSRKQSIYPAGWLFSYYRLESKLDGDYTQREYVLLKDTKEMIGKLATKNQGFVSS